MLGEMQPLHKDENDRFIPVQLGMDVTDFTLVAFWQKPDGTIVSKPSADITKTAAAQGSILVRFYFTDTDILGTGFLQVKGSFGGQIRFWPIDSIDIQDTIAFS